MCCSSATDRGDALEWQPLVVETVREFLDQVLLGNHMDSVVVLRDGIRKMRFDDAIPLDLLQVPSRKLLYNPHTTITAISRPLRFVSFIYQLLPSPTTPYVPWFLDCSAASVAEWVLGWCTTRRLYVRVWGLAT